MMVWIYTAMTLVQPVTPPPTVSAEDGKRVLAKFQCNRCHEGTGLPEPDLAMDCVQCHRDIHAGTFEANRKMLKRWKKNIVDLTATPSLVGVHQRLRRDWLTGFLKEPHDLRPALSATMPRFAMSDEEAKTLAAYLVPKVGAGDAAELTGADVARGRALVDQRGCGFCHSMSGTPKLANTTPSNMPKAPALKDALLLAPDLAQTRKRFKRSHLVKWLMDPRSVKRDALMPKSGLSEAQARDVAAFLLRTPLADVPPAPMPKPLPPLTKRVSYEAVAKAVFGHTCVHCHADPDYAIGDGGPGNTGGFGFAPRGVNLTEYETIQAGYIAADGERHSLFEKMPDGQPRLVASLWARHHEVRGKPIAGLRGMPLGLPPLTPKQIQLVDSWVRQGRPE